MNIFKKYPYVKAVVAKIAPHCKPLDKMDWSGQSAGGLKMQITNISEAKAQRRPGALKGKIKIADDFAEAFGLPA